MRQLRPAAETHTGYVRTTNQDLALVSGDLVAVADGMGGHLGGEVAARTAIEELLAAWGNDRSEQGLVSAVRRANRAVWRRSRVDRKLHGMGTTLTAVALVAGDDDADGARTHVALINIGDSRAYELEAGPGRLRRLTEDHSVVEEMVRQGELTLEEAANHPHRHVLTRALGIESDADMDLWDLQPALGTRLMLCSDGLTNEVSEEEIAEVLSSVPDVGEAARELVGRALGHGGMDNVTVVVVDVVESQEEPADVAAEMIPALPSGSEEGQRDARDITEVIPAIGASADGALAAGEALGAGDEAAGADDAPRAGDAPTEATPEAPATQALSAADGGAGAAAGAGAAGAGAGAAAAAGAGAAAAAGAGAAAAAAGAAGAAAAGADPNRPAHGRRTGRSMTVRARPKPPPIDGVLGTPGANGDGMVGAATTGHHRPVVLVPHKRMRRAGERIVTVRVALFAIVLAAVLGGTAGTVVWFNQASYYVGLDGKKVAVYQGRPGGMLWFKPQLLEDSSVTTDKLPAYIQQELHTGIKESSVSASLRLIAYLSKVRQPPTSAPTTTFPSTTTTTSTTAAIAATTLPPATVAPSTTLAPTTTTAPPPTTVPPSSTLAVTSTTRPSPPPARGH